MKNYLKKIVKYIKQGRIVVYKNNLYVLSKSGILYKYNDKKDMWKEVKYDKYTKNNR